MKNKRQLLANALITSGSMVNDMGTPKTLKNAIENGLVIGKTLWKDRADADEVMIKEIEAHVLDFLAQRFTAYTSRETIMTAADFMKLWDLIKEKRE